MALDVCIRSMYAKCARRVRFCMAHKARAHIAYLEHFSAAFLYGFSVLSFFPLSLSIKEYEKYAKYANRPVA